METQNFNVTAGQAASVNLALASIAATDEVYAIILVGNYPVLRKASVAGGGSSAEIDIVVNTRAVLKLSASDTAMLPGDNAIVTYVVVKNGVNVFGGTITVSEATAEPSYQTYEAKQYTQKKVFTADGSMPINIPANSIITKAMLYSHSATENSGEMAIVWGNGGDDISQGQGLESDEQWHKLVLDDAKIYTSEELPVEVRLNGDWTDTQISVLVSWEELPS